MDSCAKSILTPPIVALIEGFSTMGDMMTNLLNAMNNGGDKKDKKSSIDAVKVSTGTLKQVQIHPLQAAITLSGDTFNTLRKDKGKEGYTGLISFSIKEESFTVRYNKDNMIWASHQTEETKKDFVKLFLFLATDENLGKSIGVDNLKTIKE